MQNRNCFNCEHIGNYFYIILFMMNFLQACMMRMKIPSVIYIDYLFRYIWKTLNILEFYWMGKYWRSSIPETVGSRSGKSLWEEKMIMLINIIGLKVFPTKSSIFNSNMFWFIHPTLLLNKPINLYWNQCWGCFLLIVSYLNIHIIQN